VQIPRVTHKRCAQRLKLISSSDDPKLLCPSVTLSTNKPRGTPLTQLPLKLVLTDTAAHPPVSGNPLTTHSPSRALTGFVLRSYSNTPGRFETLLRKFNYRATKILAKIENTLTGASGALHSPMPLLCVAKCDTARPCLFHLECCNMCPDQSLLLCACSFWKD
jgi:hypothetical protein